MAIIQGSGTPTISLINQADDSIKIYSDYERTTLENEFVKSTGTAGEVAVITVYNKSDKGMYKVSKTVNANGKVFAEEGWYLYIPEDKLFVSNEIIMGILLSITIGMLLYINIIELLPRLVSSNNKKTVVLSVLSGIIILIISILLG